MRSAARPSRKARPARWTLFVDESGRFDDVSDPVAVAGVLLAESSGTSADALRKGLERALPGMPWPPHAAHVNQPAWVAIILGNDGAPPAGPAAQAARQALAELARHLPLDLARVEAQLRAGRRPDIAALGRLSRHLRSEQPVLARRLEAFGRESWAHLREVARLLVSDARAVLLAACEVHDGGAGGSADARYFSLLEAVLRRSVELLSRGGEGGRLGVRALERSVDEPAIGGAMPLMPRHLGGVIRRLPVESTRLVRVVAEDVSRYDGHADIRYVLADFAANRARRVLRDRELPLADAEEQLGALGLPVRSGAPARSHLAAAGSLQVSESRLWCREQADEWGCRE